MEASSRRRLLDPLGQGTTERIAVLADKVSRHCPLRFSASRLHEKKWYPFKETLLYIRGFPLAEENPFKVDLRIQGIPQNAVLEEQGRMTKIRELVNIVVLRIFVDQVSIGMN